jgi:hypothetical protein
MECKEIRELLPDLAAGMATPTPEVKTHIASCAACSAELHDFQKTMALLDEWKAPEPSPYFDTRLAARLRDEIERPPQSWFVRLAHGAWAHPACGLSAAAVLFAVALGGRSYILQTDTIATKPPSIGLPIEPGTAVGDLQALERNDELYADFDLLDELQVQDDVTANP